MISRSVTNSLRARVELAPGAGRRATSDGDGTGVFALWLSVAGSQSPLGAVTLGASQTVESVRPRW